MGNSNSPDIAIIGGGIAGAAMATVLARRGFDVVLLEREAEYRDRVRGEWIAPWGAAEFKRLGLLELLYENGAFHVEKHVPYDENWESSHAEQYALNLTKVFPGVQGPICIGHPTMCRAFSGSARTAGARVINRVVDVQVLLGPRPRVAYRSDGRSCELSPRLIIGADGRNSTVRNQLGFNVISDPPHNLVGGMLISDVPQWPRKLQAVGTAGGFHYLILPQDHDMVRLYACYEFSDQGRFSGPQKREKLLSAFRFECLPYCEEIRRGVPAGPFNAFSNEDHWIDDPTAAGIVLIGDAAGHNDPIIGQGVSIAARDVRIVSDIISSSEEWGRANFRPYVDERRERMRRLRILGRLESSVRVQFDLEARFRRARLHQRSLEQQLSPLPAALIGPELLPAEAFASDTIAKLLTP